MVQSTSFSSQTIVYPSSDGLPMAESDFQRRALMDAVGALDVYFQDRDDIYVSGNLFIYYEEGNPKSVVAPDVFVVIGAEKRDRPSYMLWLEPKGPDFVLEVTSRSTRSEDQGPKRGTYAFLGVREYWQYDPTGDYLTPPLRGLRLVGSNYEPLPATALSGGDVSSHSSVLGLELRLEQGRLRFYDPATRQPLLTLREAEAEVRREAAARQAAEARIAELEARLRAQEEPS
ncbi:MAG: Uma2 family endonuclease [Candidatus Tectomicrobia bacterium]|nr:Uma2 family endonuclease [Candidatus Tectomicrobia bacterium]